MAAARIPSAVELMRLPAGDRVLRLRWLARWHREQVAVHEAAGSPSGVTRHRNSLRKVMTAAAQVGAEIYGDFVVLSGSTSALAVGAGSSPSRSATGRPASPRRR